MWVKLSNICLFSQTSSVALPIGSLSDTWKLEKCRLQQSYQQFFDDMIRAIQPQVRSGRVWRPDKELDCAERDLVCEEVRGMVQPYSRAGIGFGEWKKPWKKMKTDMSWHTLFKYGDSLTGFMLSATYGTVVTPN